MTGYGLDNREEVHELEFLGLLAFLAREIIGLRGIISPKAGNKFSPKDLEMAYALHNKQRRHGGLRTHASPPRPPQENLMGVGSRHVSPQAYYPHNIPDYPASPKHNSAMMADSLQIPSPTHHHQQQGRGFEVDLQKEAAEWQNQFSPRREDFDRGSSQIPTQRDPTRYYQQLQEEHPVRQSAMLGSGPSPPGGGIRPMLSEPLRDSHPVSMLGPSPTSGSVPPLQLQSDNRQFVPPIGGGLMGSVRVQGTTLGPYNSGGRQTQEDGKLSGN